MSYGVIPISCIEVVTEVGQELRGRVSLYFGLRFSSEGLYIGFYGFKDAVIVNDVRQEKRVCFLVFDVRGLGLKRLLCRVLLG